MTDVQELNAGEIHEKEFTIIVNTREKTVTTKKLTFDELVALGYGS